jgi:predicted DNA-binding antitoxin AbrB/MazE fold protein
MAIAVDAIYENGVLKPKASLDLPDKAEVRLTVEAVARASRTALGKKLQELRSRILESGATTLDWNQIEDEVRARRGGWREER